MVVVNQLRWQGIIETPRTMDYSHFNLKEINLVDFSVDYVHLAAFQHHFLAEFNLPVVSNFLASVNSAISARVL